MAAKLGLDLPLIAFHPLRLSADSCEQDDDRPKKLWFDRLIPVRKE